MTLSSIKRMVAAMLFAVLTTMFAVGCSDDGDEGTSGSKLPAIPTATGGSLEEHSGENGAVTQENLEEFYLELGRALNGSSYARSVRALQSEEDIGKDTTEDGYGGLWVDDYSGKYEWDEENDNEISAYADKIQFFNYSKSQGLFLGGAVGAASYYEDLGYDLGEMGANGTIKFNGSFEGSIEFQNAYLNIDFEEQKLLSSSGKVVIKSGGQEINVDLMDLVYMGDTDGNEIGDLVYW